MAIRVRAASSVPRSLRSSLVPLPSSLLFLTAALSLTSGLGAATVPLDRIVASLVADLGADPYDARERATASLRKIGEPARAALEEAAKSDDPEIRVRARGLVADIRSGIRPHWSAETVLLLRHYDRTPAHSRYQPLQQLVGALGHEAVPFLIERIAKGDNNESNYALRFLQQIKDDRAWKQVLALVQNPDNDKLVNALAWARGKSGETIAAIEGLARKQIKQGDLKPEVEKAIQAVVAQLAAEKHQEAAAAAEKLAKAAPADARPLYLQAEALVALDKDREAVALRKRALALNPEKEAPHLLAGALLGDLGRRRLAAREWEKILTIPPNTGIYDINAYLSLSSIYAASGLFEQAAQYLAKTQDRFGKLKEADKNAVPGGTIESLQMEQTRLQQLTSRFPTPANAVIHEPIPDSELKAAVAIAVKDGEPDSLQKALTRCATQIRLDVQSPGLDLFDDTSAVLRYDKAKKQLLVLLGDKPACAPIAFEAKEKAFRVAVHLTDRTHILKLDADTGEAEPHAKFEQDYRLTLKPGAKLATFSDVELRLNGKGYKWDAATDKGLKLDRLPDRLDIHLSGTSPSGARLTARFRLPTPKPTLPAPRP